MNDSYSPEALHEAYQHIWFVVARSQDIDVPLPAQLLGRRLVVFRDSDGQAPARCGFMAAVENFRDMAHFRFVHGESMGEVNPVVADLDVQRDGREVRASFFYEQVAGSDFSDTGDAWMHYHTYAPASPRSSTTSVPRSASATSSTSPRPSATTSA